MKEIFEEMIEKQVMRVMEMVENGAEPKEKVRRKVKEVLGRSIAALNKSHRKRGEKEVEIDARNSKLLRLALIMEETVKRIKRLGETPYKEVKDVESRWWDMSERIIGGMMVIKIARGERGMESGSME